MQIVKDKGEKKITGSIVTIYSLQLRLYALK